MRIRAVMALTLAALSVAGGFTVDDFDGAFVSEKPGKLLAQAVGELNDGFDALYGKRYKGLYRRPGGPTLAIGAKAALELGWIGEDELKAVHYGGFVIRTTKDGIAIAGRQPYGTLLGVRHYLGLLGYRQYGRLPRGVRTVTVADTPATRELPIVNADLIPDMPMRNYENREDQARPDEALAAIDPRLARDSNLWIDHSAGFLIPKALYYDQHPEYYALLGNGTRIGKDAFDDKRTPLCLSNPDVRRISIERTLKWIESQPDKTIFPVTYGDTRIWCACEPCRQLDEAPGQHAARLLTWANAIARAVAEKHPEIIIITFAYGGSDQAPANIKPEPNMRIVLSSGLDMPFFGHREKLGVLLPGQVAKIRGWAKVAPGQVWVCEYSGDRYFPGMPGQQKDKLTWYHNEGVRGIMYSYGHPRHLAPLWSHLYRHLMWDIDTDPLAIGKDFCRNYYGGGGDAMARFVELMYHRYQQTKSTVTAETFIDGYPADFYTVDYLREALAALEEARGASEWTIAKELRDETSRFIEDALQHPGDVDEKTVDLLLGSLRRMRSDSEAELVQFARDAHALGIAAEKRRPGMMALIKQWLAGQELPLPKARQQERGVRLEARTFMFGHGPEPYVGGHKGPKVPEREATVIYVPGNDQGRSDRMTAQFELYNPPQGTTTLVLEGLDSDAREKWPAHIDVQLNDTTIYTGKTTFGKWEWSRQEIEIPPGLLQEGINHLTIQNTSDPKSVRLWHERWFMLSGAEIRF